MKRAEPGIRAPGPALTTTTILREWHVMATADLTTCLFCGRAFRPHRPSTPSKFCGVHCANRHRRGEGLHRDPVTCTGCGKEFVPTGRVWRSCKFCSDTCRGRYQRGISPDHPSVNLSSGTLGALNEMVATCDLLRRGFHVFRSISPSCPCDLIAMVDGRCWRVEVTSGCIRADGTLYYVPHDLEKSDVIAAVLPDNQVRYVPGPPDLSTADSLVRPTSRPSYPILPGRDPIRPSD